eukprot:scaffold1850_cov194-Pinguiococcus_pyrenoidosus.AAC.66
MEGGPKGSPASQAEKLEEVAVGPLLPDLERIHPAVTQRCLRCQIRRMRRRHIRLVEEDAGDVAVEQPVQVQQSLQRRRRTTRGVERTQRLVIGRRGKRDRQVLLVEEDAGLVAVEQLVQAWQRLQRRLRERGRRQRRQSFRSAFGSEDLAQLAAGGVFSQRVHNPTDIHARWR